MTAPYIYSYVFISIISLFVPKFALKVILLFLLERKHHSPDPILFFLHGKGSIGPLFTMRPSDSHCCRVLIISNISISKTWFMLSSTLVNFSALRVFYCRIEFIISIFSCDYQLKKWFCHSSVRLCVCNQQVFPKPHEFQWCSLKV